MATRVPTYVSNTEKNLKIGVSNYSEDKVSLEVIGLVGIGSTTPTDILDVQGTTKSKGLNITGVSTFAGITTNTGTLFANQLNVAGVSTFNDNVVIISDKNLGVGDLSIKHFDSISVASITLPSGQIITQTDGFTVQNNSGQKYIKATSTNTGLYHVGTQKLRTSTDGVQVVNNAGGSLGTMTALNVDTTFLKASGVSTFIGDASFSGNVSIAGTLTYEDVTNIDAIGIITAGNGLRVTQGGINVTTGISTFGGNIDADGNLDVDGTTDLDVLNVAETATFSALVDVNNRLDVVGGANIDQLNITGISTFKDDVEFHGAAGVTSVRFDKSDDSLKFVAGAKLKLGSNLEIFQDASGTSRIHATDSSHRLQIRATDFRIAGSNGLKNSLRAETGGAVKLYFDNQTKIQTTNEGVLVSGGTTTGTLSVTGVSTFVGVSTFKNKVFIGGGSTISDAQLYLGQDLRIRTSGQTVAFEVPPSSPGTILTFISTPSLLVGNASGSYASFNSGGGNLFANNVNKFQVRNEGVLVSGGATITGDIDANGNIVGDTATNISGINSVTATAFFGDGSGLENTGATLSAASGSQRLVLSSLTSGTMTSAATDADLAFNATSNLLSAGKLNVVGLTTISNLKVDSGIVTAASGIATYNGDLVIGTPSAGFKSGAFAINTTDKTKDSINELNFILGKLVPTPPDTINGVSFTFSLGTGRLCAGFTPTNNTGGSHAVVAGTQYSRNTDSTVTSNTLTEFGPGDSETVTGFVNAVGVGTTTLTVGVNNGTFDKLVISNNEDAANSSRNTGITSQFYEIYDARLLNAVSPDGFNKAFIQQGISTTSSAFWYEDPSTVSAPVISFSPVVYPGSPTLSYSSGIPHYTQASANAFLYALGVENASGDMYTQNTFVSSDGQTSGFQNPGNKSYTNFTGGTNPPAQNYGVGAAVTTQVSQQPRDLHLTATSNVFTSFDASTPYGSHNNQRVGFTTDVNIMGTTARTNVIDEDNISISSLGTGSGNAERVNAGSTGDNPSPVFTAWGGGSAGSIATYEAAVRGGTLRHDQTNYSTGYLPAGPDYSGSRSGTQYFQIELIRSNVSEFSISYTGSVAGCFICMPQNSAWTTSLSGVNGWADMFQAYKGSGIPTSAEPGCSSGGLMDNNGGTFTCVFGTESSSNDTGNRILIRWKLTSGQSITAMSFTST